LQNGNNGRSNGIANKRDNMRCNSAHNRNCNIQKESGIC